MKRIQLVIAVAAFGGIVGMTQAETDGDRPRFSESERKEMAERKHQMKERHSKSSGERGQGDESTHKRPGRDKPSSKGPGGKMDGDHDARMLGMLVNNPRMAEEVGLSKEKVAEIKQKFERYHHAMKEQSEKMREVGLHQLEAMRNSSTTEEQMLALVEDAGRIHTEMAKLRIKQLYTIRNSLSDEERKGIREFVGKRMKERRKHMGSREGGQSGDSATERKQAPVGGFRRGDRSSFGSQGESTRDHSDRRRGGKPDARRDAE